MKKGYVCPFKEERLEFSPKLGFDGVELAVAWPNFPLNPITITKDELKRAREYFDEKHIKALTVQYGWNYYELWGENIKGILNNFKSCMDICDAMGTKILTTNGWVPKTNFKEQESFIRKLYPELGKIASDRGIKVAIENCPHDGHNYVATPAAMERFLNIVNSDSIGLQLDPSHLVWLGCDYIDAAKRFGKQVISVHAKDTEVNEKVLKDVGIYGTGWWRYRIPGWGNVNWKAMFTALFENGFNGPVIIEHEDPVFDGALFEEGLKKGKEFLEQIVF